MTILKTVLLSLHSNISIGRTNAKVERILSRS